MYRPNCLFVATLALAATACQPITLTTPPPTPEPTHVETVVPVQQSNTPAPTQAVAEATQTPLPPTPQGTLETPGVTPGAILGEHQVMAGETLSCIGRGYGVLPKAVADANGIALTSILHVGQRLKIPALQWMNIPAGPVCPPQFPPPFPTGTTVDGSGGPGPRPPEAPTATQPRGPVGGGSPTPGVNTPVLPTPAPPTATDPPIPVTATPDLRPPDTSVPKATPLPRLTVILPRLTLRPFATWTFTPPPGPTGVPGTS
jgi:LysM repeat protein